MMQKVRIVKMYKCKEILDSVEKTKGEMYNMVNKTKNKKGTNVKNRRRG